MTSLHDQKHGTDMRLKAGSLMWPCDARLRRPLALLGSPQNAAA